MLVAEAVHGPGFASRQPFFALNHGYVEQNNCVCGGMPNALYTAARLRLCINPKIDPQCPAQPNIIRFVESKL